MVAEVMLPPEIFVPVVTVLYAMVHGQRTLQTQGQGPGTADGKVSQGTRASAGIWDGASTHHQKKSNYQQPKQAGKGFPLMPQGKNVVPWVLAQGGPYWIPEPQMYIYFNW